MKFSEVLGQETVKQQLINLVRNNRLSHALLFHGKEGVGKKALALAFAQYILCENKSETDSCGECPACKKAAKLIHPDEHFIFPVIKDSSKVSISDSYIKEWREELFHNPYFTYSQWNAAIGDGKKAGQIYVDESNEIIKKLNFKAFEADYKVMLIWLPEKMNVQTANKLLKTLEEPAEKTVLILIAENLDFMLSTILSRVQQIKIPPIKKETIKTYLQENFSASEDQIEFANHFAKGQLNRAVEAIQQNESNQMYHNWFVNFMRLSFTNKMNELIELNDEIIAHDKNDLKGFLAYAIRYVRDNFMLNLNQKDLVALVENEANFASKFSNFINENNIDKIYTSFNETIAGVERNANVKIQMQVLAIEMVRAFKMI
jgi:DNA polymerase-3 subunit delta'